MSLGAVAVGLDVGGDLLLDQWGGRLGIDGNVVRGERWWGVYGRAGVGDQLRSDVHMTS